jgi:hypothetical protein
MGKEPKPSEWERYREVVPKHVRENLKTRLLEAEMMGYSSFLKMATFITAEVVSGNIPPSIATEARAWAELVMTAIAAKQMQEKDKGGNRSLIKTLSQAQNKSKRQVKAISYDNTSDFIPDGLETMDGEKISAEPNWVSSTPVAAADNTPGE